MRCARCQAVFCVTPRSRCSFMLDTPLRLVLMRYAANAHLDRGRLEPCMTVPCFTEKSLPQSRQRNGWGLARPALRDRQRATHGAGYAVGPAGRDELPFNRRLVGETLYSMALHQKSPLMQKSKTAAYLRCLVTSTARDQVLKVYDGPSRLDRNLTVRRTTTIDNAATRMYRITFHHGSNRASTNEASQFI